jgi:hypothetical protein
MNKNKHFGIDGIYGNQQDEATYQTVFQYRHTSEVMEQGRTRVFVVGGSKWGGGGGGCGRG